MSGPDISDGSEISFLWKFPPAGPALSGKMFSSLFVSLIPPPRPPRPPSHPVPVPVVGHPDRHGALTSPDTHVGCDCGAVSWNILYWINIFLFDKM